MKFLFIFVFLFSLTILSNTEFLCYTKDNSIGITFKFTKSTTIKDVLIYFYRYSTSGYYSNIYNDSQFKSDNENLVNFNNYNFALSPDCAGRIFLPIESKEFEANFDGYLEGICGDELIGEDLICKEK